MIAPTAFSTLPPVTAFAALTGPLPKAGVVLVALFAAWALLAGDARGRATAMVGALALAPVLLLADFWHSPQLNVLHRHTLFVLAGSAVALGVVIAAGMLLAGRAWLLGPLAVLALPFRVPIQAGGTTSNLLVPLYLVVGVGALAWIVPALREQSFARGKRRTVSPDASGGWAVWVDRALALYIVLYAIQA